MSVGYFPVIITTQTFATFWVKRSDMLQDLAPRLIKSNSSRPSDHSVLELVINAPDMSDNAIDLLKPPNDLHNDDFIKNVPVTHPGPDPKQYFTKYCNLHVNNDFMKNDTRKLAVSDIIDYMERLNNTERNINDCVVRFSMNYMYFLRDLILVHMRSISIASNTGMTN